ncbi:hypothetical protein [Pseudomonas kilonensis]|uniref:hypothetical protein n=1 Tax=Pseudomonas kilonensis TaxID=132476 RepID=UPI0020A04F2B|nr:hypothetical protein [Pseudomonas kilonensis]MCP1454124.1 hypothetical protein [Pseudomonas kilonensis]
MGELLPKPSIDSEQEGINFPLSALLKKMGADLFLAKFLNIYVPFFNSAQAAAENAFSQKGFDVAGKYIEKVWVPSPSNPRTGAWVPK